MFYTDSQNYKSHWGNFPYEAGYVLADFYWCLIPFTQSAYTNNLMIVDTGIYEARSMLRKCGEVIKAKQNTNPYDLLFSTNSQQDL